MNFIISVILNLPNNQECNSWSTTIPADHCIPAPLKQECSYSLLAVGLINLIRCSAIHYFLPELPLAAALRTGLIEHWFCTSCNLLCYNNSLVQASYVNPVTHHYNVYSPFKIYLILTVNNSLTIKYDYKHKEKVNTKLYHVNFGVIYCYEILFCIIYLLIILTYLLFMELC